jgi:hypothetical protein
VTGHANGPGPNLPPIDPGNTFIVQRATPHTLDDGLQVTVTEVEGAPDPVWQTSIPAATADGATRVLVTTWRCGPATLTVLLTREDAVKLGRRVAKAAVLTAPTLVIAGPSAQVAQRVLAVVVEADGCRIRMRWSRDDAAKLGGALVQAAQGMGGIITPGPGVHP